jgi:Uma2 family endonuclease
VSTQPKRFLTPEEYLEIEYVAEYKSEYFAGEMFAMVGVSSNESRLAVQTSYHLSTQLMARSCCVYGSDMRILVKETGLYTYANLIVVQDPPQLEGALNHNAAEPHSHRRSALALHRSILTGASSSSTIARFHHSCNTS